MSDFTSGFWSIFVAVATIVSIAACALLLQALSRRKVASDPDKTGHLWDEDLDEYNRLAVQAGREPLKRILLILDEFSSTLMSMGGAPLAEHGGTLVRERRAWAAETADRYATLCAAIGEQAPAAMRAVAVRICCCASSS